MVVGVVGGGTVVLPLAGNVAQLGNGVKVGVEVQDVLAVEALAGLDKVQVALLELAHLDDIVRDAAQDLVFLAEDGVDLEVGGPQQLLCVVGDGVVEVGKDEGLAGRAIAGGISGLLQRGRAQRRLLLQGGGEVLAGSAAIGAAVEVLLEGFGAALEGLGVGGHGGHGGQAGRRALAGPRAKGVCDPTVGREVRRRHGARDGERSGGRAPFMSEGVGGGGGEARALGGRGGPAEAERQTPATQGDGARVCGVEGGRGDCAGGRRASGRASVEECWGGESWAWAWAWAWACRSPRKARVLSRLPSLVISNSITTS